MTRLLVLIILIMAVLACAISSTPNPVPPPTAAATLLPGLTATLANAPVSPTQIGGGAIPASPYDPKPGDAQLARGNVFIDSAQMLAQQTFPVQVRLQIKGSLPTPCHQLRVKTTAASSLIQIETYSVVDSKLACVQVLQEFNASIPLGSFTGGKTSVILNGKPVGEISP